MKKKIEGDNNFQQCKRRCTENASKQELSMIKTLQSSNKPGQNPKVQGCLLSRGGSFILNGPDILAVQSNN